MADYSVEKKQYWCKVCRKQIYPAPSSIAKGGGKYCSRECRRLDKNVQKECVVCSAVYWKPKSQINQNRSGNFCSMKCYDSYRSCSVLLVCQTCGKEYSVWQSRHNRDPSRFCSSECKADGMKERFRGDGNPMYKAKVVVICAACGKGFEKHESRTRRNQNHLCSRLCYAAWREREYVGEKNPGYVNGTTTRTQQRTRKKAWKLIADAVRLGRGNVCEVCGAVGGKRKFPVHHKIPWEVSRDDGHDNLLVVCSSCHGKLDAEYRRSLM
jgi:hypothetical protein